MPNRFLIYGANGYTGELVTRYAVERGMKPIVAGRNAIAVESVAKKYHLDYRVFSLDEGYRIENTLQEVAILNHAIATSTTHSSEHIFETRHTLPLAQLADISERHQCERRRSDASGC